MIRAAGKLGPVEGVKTERLAVLVRAHALSSPAALAVLLECHRAKEYAVFEHDGKARGVVGQSPASAIAPGPLQVDADQFPEQGKVERVGGFGNEGREVSARIGRQRDLEGIDAVGELGRERFEGRHGHGRPLGGWGSSPVKASAELLENTSTVRSSARFLGRSRPLRNRRS